MPEEKEKWEVVGRQGGERHAIITMRVKVPGGWLVMVESTVGVEIRKDVYDVNTYGGSTFYPDPNHEWDGLYQTSEAELAEIYKTIDTE